MHCGLPGERGQGSARRLGVVQERAGGDRVAGPDGGEERPVGERRGSRRARLRPPRRSARPWVIGSARHFFAGWREGDGAVTPLLHLGMAQWWTTGVASGSGLLAGRRSAILGGRAQGAVGLTLGLTATAPLETRCFQKYKLHRYFLS